MFALQSCVKSRCRIRRGKSTRRCLRVGIFEKKKPQQPRVRAWHKTRIIGPCAHQDARLPLRSTERPVKEGSAHDDFTDEDDARNAIVRVLPAHAGLVRRRGEAPDKVLRSFTRKDDIGGGSLFPAPSGRGTCPFQEHVQRERSGDQVSSSLGIAPTARSRASNAVRSSPCVWSTMPTSQPSGTPADPYGRSEVSVSVPYRQSPSAPVAAAARPV